ncbi:RDD family protein [Streptomyces sp. NPDC020965]|uniref:RDD family protein n=1 Tax=Streptomyces sp. NPDC020965 TaxID=3365105 RepID=UPI0037A3F548
MSAPTPVSGDGSPTPGYYPDPSIPGYVRYWNGAAWVPGTSRPAPKGGEAAGPSAPEVVPPPVAAVEETGPVFLDEEPVVDQAVRPEPATVWQADTSRQNGFGGERDHRVSWRGAAEPQVPGDPSPRVVGQGPDPRQAPEVRQGPDPRLPAQAVDPTGGALPGARTPGPVLPPVEGTVTIRPRTPSEPQPQPQPQQLPAVGTMTIRGRQRNDTEQPPPQRQAPPELARSPQPHAQPLQLPPQPAPGAASWAQQAHQAQQVPQPGPAQGGVEPPVVPWKPPVTDPFLQAAQAQAAARPAPLGKRLLARLIDTLMLGALVGAVAFPVGSQAVTHVDDKIEAAKQSGQTVTVWLVDSTTAVHLAIILGALLVLGVLYEALPTAKWGRTLGKKLCGLTVVDIEAHEPPTFGAALRRWLVYGVLGMIAIGVVNVFWCLVDRPWRQCWHDKSAHTFVKTG